jgi:hypothetical protein
VYAISVKDGSCVVTKVRKLNKKWWEGGPYQSSHEYPVQDHSLQEYLDMRFGENIVTFHSIGNQTIRSRYSIIEKLDIYYKINK